MDRGAQQVQSIGSPRAQHDWVTGTLSLSLVFYLRNLWLVQGYRDFSFMFSSRSFRVPCLIFRSISHFKFIFIWGMDQNYFSHMDNQLSWLHLLKRLFFLHWTAFIPLSIITDQGGVASRALAQSGGGLACKTEQSPPPTPSPAQGDPKRSRRQWEPELLWPHQSAAWPRTYGALGAGRDLKPDWWRPSSICPSEGHGSLVWFCWRHWAACSALAPQPGVNPTPPALERGDLTTGLPGNSTTIKLLSENSKMTPYYLGLDKDFLNTKSTSNEGKSR